MKSLKTNLNNLPIEKKLRYSSIVITTFVVLLLSVTFLVTEYHRYKTSIESDLKNNSRIIAENISSALLFDDLVTANEILDTLKAKPKIIYAAVFDNDNKLFASYKTDRAYNLIPNKENTILWETESVLIRTPVVQRGEKLGSVMLVYTQEEFKKYMHFLILLAMISVVVSVIIANLLFSWMQNRVIQPLLDLTTAMQKVTREKDFTIQIKNDSSDEIGILSRGFNKMIVKIKEELDFRSTVEEELKDIAMFDQLTRLPNRHYFHLHLDETIKRNRRTNTFFALLFIDLDGFKNVNDTMGHDYGDLLLKEVAQRMQRCVREGDFVARLGGDEFTIILENISEREDIVKICDKINYEVSREITLGNKKAYVSCSIGIARYMIDSDNSGDLMQYADLAMYYAKENGKNDNVFYDENLKIEKSRVHIVETHLRTAIEKGELTLLYQPKMNIKTDTIESMEALLRWKSGKLGFVSPAEFIPIAEGSSLIIDIENWVIEEVCRQLQIWQERFSQKYRIAINISQLHFKQKNFLDEFNAVIQKYQTDPNLLEIELTESVFMNKTDENIQKLYYLQSLGVEISIDDFGTGYSSLSYLKQLPINNIKIDKSFIDGLPDEKDDVVITRTIIDLSSRFGLKTIAEGVENMSQVTMLREMGCDMIQGYFFFKPQHPDALEKLLQEGIKI